MGWITNLPSLLFTSWCPMSRVTGTTTISSTTIIEFPIKNIDSYNNDPIGRKTRKPYCFLVELSCPSSLFFLFFLLHLSFKPLLYIL